MSDIDIVVADGLKVLDLKRPIREADVSSKGLAAFSLRYTHPWLMGEYPCGGAAQADKPNE